MLTLTVPRVVASFIETKPSRRLRTEGVADPERTRLVEQIVTMNHGATATFLERFGTPDLKRYLGHLEVSTGPRGAGSRWVRPEGSPAIVVHETRG